MNSEEPEAAESLHSSPGDGEGGVSSLLTLPELPELHNQLLSFAEVKMDVVVRARAYSL